MGVAQEVIAVDRASKRYREVLAVDSLSVHVEQGEIYALLGLNGAGKTTLIRMLLGLVRPTSGRVAVFGSVVPSHSHALWSRVGYLVETPAAYPDLTVRENLDLIRRLRRIGDRAVVDDVIERLGLSAYAHRRAGTLSLGNAQRLGLAKALLHQPPLVVLDEPANGLDPAGVVEIRQLLLDLAASGTTVFLSSHVLAEVARLATRIGIVHAGRMRRELSVADLATAADHRLVIATRDDAAAATALLAAGYAVTVEAGGLVCRDGSAIQAPDRVAVALVAAGTPPTRLSVEHEDLESFFLRTVDEVHDHAA